MTQAFVLFQGAVAEVQNLPANVIFNLQLMGREATSLLIISRQTWCSDEVLVTPSSRLRKAPHMEGHVCKIVQYRPRF